MVEASYCGSGRSNPSSYLRAYFRSWSIVKVVSWSIEDKASLGKSFPNWSVDSPSPSSSK